MIGFYKTKGALIAGIALVCGGCAEQLPPRVIMSHKDFNIQLPFTTDTRGILVPSYWGKEKTALLLTLDNHSPTWANNNVISGNTAITKSKDYQYRTTTADGKLIKGDVYFCDSIRIGSIGFKKVAFYNISNETNAGRPDGVIGENIMREGAWKIDFKHQQLQFASSPDSIKGWEKADLLPSSFTGDVIEINMQFSNAVNHLLELDLGYNGFVIVPAAIFLNITGNKNIYKDSMRFSTPASTAIVQNSIARDSICMGHQCIGTLITTNHLVKESLVGLRFFNQFAFIILDYKRHRVYVSKERIRAMVQ